MLHPEAGKTSSCYSLVGHQVQPLSKNKNMTVRLAMERKSTKIFREKIGFDLKAIFTNLPTLDNNLECTVCNLSFISEKWNLPHILFTDYVRLWNGAVVVNIATFIVTFLVTFLVTVFATVVATVVATLQQLSQQLSLVSVFQINITRNPIQYTFN